MEYFGLKTSGHSGTQLKHKRAFTHTPKFLNNQDTFENVKIESAENMDRFNGLPFLRIILVLNFFTIVSIIVSIFIYRIDIMMVENKEANTIQHIRSLNKKKSSEEKFKKNLFEKAKNEYTNGNYLYADEKFYAILLNDENNIAGENMLIKVIEAKCSHFNIGCKQLLKYSEYLDEKYENIDESTPKSTDFYKMNYFG